MLSVALFLLLFLVFLRTTSVSSSATFEPLANAASGSPSAIQEFADADIHLLKLSNDTMLLYFYADWCGACKNFGSKFDRLAASSQSQSLKFGRVNYSTNPKLSVHFALKYLPSIYHIHGGEYREITEYRDDLIAFLKADKWKNVQPTRSFFAPFSPLMTFVALLADVGHRLVVIAGKLSTWQLATIPVFFVIGVFIFSYLLGRNLCQTSYTQSMSRNTVGSKKSQ